jgi:hypothetical protein
MTASFNRVAPENKARNTLGLKLVAAGGSRRERDGGILEQRTLKATRIAVAPVVSAGWFA